MKIKTIMSYYLTQVRGPSSKNLQAINATEDVERRKLSYTFDGNVIWYSDYGEQYEDSFKKKTKIVLPAIPLLGVFPEKTIIPNY